MNQRPGLPARGTQLGVLLLVTGMALWILGVLVPAVLLPGIYLAALALLLLSAAGVAAVALPSGTGSAEPGSGT